MMGWEWGVIAAKEDRCIQLDSNERPHALMEMLSERITAGS